MVYVCLLAGYGHLLASLPRLLPGQHPEYGYGSCTGLISMSGEEFRLLTVCAGMMGQHIPEWRGLALIQNHKHWVTHNLFNSWCLIDGGVQYALLMKANKPETAVQGSAFIFCLAQHGLLYHVEEVSSCP